MSQPGYVNFAESPVFGSLPILDGVQLSSMYFPVQRTPSGGAHLLEHANGAVTVQIPYYGGDQPLAKDRYEFTLNFDARDEATWWMLERTRKRREPVYFVSFDQEEELFRAGVSLTAFELPRPLASSVVTHDDLDDYTTLAWLDDVAQDVISTGTPNAGEVKVVGRDVTTPTLTAGQVLRIRYLPAYYVMVADLPQTLAGFNDLSRQATLVEVRSS